MKSVACIHHTTDEDRTGSSSEKDRRRASCAKSTAQGARGPLRRRDWARLIGICDGCRLIAAIAIVLAPLASGALAQPPPAVEHLRIKVQELPAYPQDLIILGVRQGDARLAYSVDAAGNVDDCLAIGYTRIEFAKAAEGALRRWKFEPSKLGGVPVASTSELAMHFEVQGIIVTEPNMSEEMMGRFISLDVLGLGYRARELRELDRIPTPVSVVSPPYSIGMAEQGHSGDVTVSFYIDETGAVRLPFVDPKDDQQLAALAVNVIGKWKFEPPTCGGVPALVRASQVFRFLKPKGQAPRG